MNSGEIYLRNPTPLRSNHLTGFFSLFYKLTNQPIFVQMPNNPSYWVPVYSTVEKLEESAAELGVVGWKIVKIDDGVDFSESVFSAGYRIMLDPYILPNDKVTRWTEIVR